MAHIPSGTTAQMELVTFRQALEAANTPSEEHDIENGSMPPISTRNTVIFWVHGEIIR